MDTATVLRYSFPVVERIGTEDLAEDLDDPFSA
jgi:hypothetical protein